MSQAVIGYGEIGHAVNEILWVGTRQQDIYIIDPLYTGDAKLVGDIEVMHICFPYSEDFVKSLQGYIEQYKPEHLVIWSTLPIGITRGFPGAVHSPTEGKHPDLENSIRQMERWIGYNDKAEGQWFYNYFTDLGLKVKLVENSDFTEALKLLSTTEYGINIEFARYKKHVADELGMDYELTKEFNIEYNKLYKTLGLEKKYQKFVLDAPDGPKGGHCITPNSRILHDQFPSEFTKIVGEL